MFGNEIMSSFTHYRNGLTIETVKFFISFRDEVMVNDGETESESGSFLVFRFAQIKLWDALTYAISLDPEICIQECIYFMVLWRMGFPAMVLGCL